MYPVVLVTYEIVCSAGNAADIGPLLKSFLGYTSTDGQASLDELGAAPLPASIQTQVIASVQIASVELRRETGGAQCGFARG